MSEDCDRLIRLLQREPGDRFTSAQEIIRELDGDQSGWLSRDPQFDRHRLAAVAIGAVLLLLVIALVLIYAPLSGARLMRGS